MLCPLIPTLNRFQSSQVNWPLAQSPLQLTFWLPCTSWQNYLQCTSFQLSSALPFHQHILMDLTGLPYHLSGISTAFMARWLIAWQDGATIGCNFFRRSSSARQGVRLRNGIEYPVIFQNKANRIKEAIYLQSPPIHGSVKIKRKWLNRLNLSKSIQSGRILKCSGPKTCWGLEQHLPHLHFNLAQQPITDQLTLDLESSPTLTVILKRRTR